MIRQKLELIALYNLDEILPPEIWWIVLELSGLVRLHKNHFRWDLYIPRFIFSKQLLKWQRKNQPG